MAYKGKYQLKNTHKYIGNPMNVIYRSLWERKFMVYADNSDNILEWGSEEHIIPYVSPWDGRRHRYFPDFYIKAKQQKISGDTELISRMFKEKLYAIEPRFFGRWVDPKEMQELVVLDLYVSILLSTCVAT